LDPASVQGAITWGIVAGLATSAFLFVLGRLLSKVVLPWYEALIYKGVDLRGVWTQEYDAHGAHYSIQLSFDQHAHRITGTGTFTKSGTGATDYVQFFTMEGSTWEGFLVLNMRSKTRTSLSFVAGLVKVKNRGRALSGHWVYRGGVSDEAESEALNLVRRDM
jgi:hypothetical protein